METSLAVDSNGIEVIWHDIASTQIYNRTSDRERQMSQVSQVVSSCELPRIQLILCWLRSAEPRLGQMGQYLPRPIVLYRPGHIHILIVSRQR